MRLNATIRTIATIVVAVVSLQLTVPARQRDVSHESARAKTPDWVRTGVIYEIFPRDFSASGDFNGVTTQLDRLKELGVTILWLMPIHPIGKVKRKGPIGSPYAVRDYYAINPDYGKAGDLKRLIAEAHRRGMKVIIDIVANHTAWDSVMMKHPDFYVRDAAGKVASPHDWSDVAELNYDNPNLRRYMIDMLKFWLTDFDLDGFRCDVAAEVPTDFWEQARAELDRVKPDTVMLAEADTPELVVRAFDLDYSWPLSRTLTAVVQGRQPASEFRATWEADAAKYPTGALRMRYTDNHDEPRAIARFGAPAALASSVLMFTLDGVPMIYNGQEVGDTSESGDPALFYTIPIFWPIEKRRPQFPAFYRQMIALRKSHPALTSGRLEWLKNSDESRIVTFRRSGGGEEIVVAINFSNRPFSGTVQAPDGGGWTDLVTQADATLPDLTLDAWGYRVVRRSFGGDRD